MAVEYAFGVRPNAETSRHPRTVEEQRALCETHYRRLAGHAYSLVGDSGLAEEITQEAFVRLLARWHSVRHPVAYLYLVVANLARRNWRRRRSEEQALRLAVPRPGEATLPAYDPALADAVARLPRRCREVVVLHYLADLPVDVVAEHLGLASGSVKRLLHKARGLLAAALEEGAS